MEITSSVGSIHPARTIRNVIRFKGGIAPEFAEDSLPQLVLVAGVGAYRNLENRELDPRDRQGYVPETDCRRLFRGHSVSFIIFFEVRFPPDGSMKCGRGVTGVDPLLKSLGIRCPG